MGCSCFPKKLDEEKKLEFAYALPSYQQKGDNLQNNAANNNIYSNNNNNNNENTEEGQYFNENFRIIKTDRVKESELQELYYNFPPLKDGVVVETKGPLLDIHEKVIYYGEWDTKEDVRHGRGIQVWPRGRRYKGYWKNNLPYDINE